MPTSPPPPGATAGANRAARGCPNCKSVVPAGSAKCPKCGLEVAKMAGFLAAMRAAQKKGMGRTEIERSRIPMAMAQEVAPQPSIVPKLVAMVLVLVVLGGGAFWFFTRPKIPAWSLLPTTKEAAAQQLLGYIASGDDTQYDKGYAMIAPEARDPADDDERGHYRGLFHAIHLYLAGEFGDGWEKTATLTPDKVNPDVLAVGIGPETLHLKLSQQTPKEQLAAAHEHYAVVGFDEFDVRDAAGYQGNEARMGVIRGLAGGAAVDNLQTVLGATARAHETNMQKKLRLLPILRNPRETVWKTVIQAYPLHNDPVVRARLAQIAADDRYDPMVREKAKNVLADKVDIEDKIAAGIAE